MVLCISSESNIFKVENDVKVKNNASRCGFCKGRDRPIPTWVEGVAPFSCELRFSIYLEKESLYLLEKFELKFYYSYYSQSQPSPYVLTYESSIFERHGTIIFTYNLITILPTV